MTRHSNHLRMVSQLCNIGHGYSEEYLETRATLPKVYHYHALLVEHVKLTTARR